MNTYTQFPLTMFAATGSQADRADKNKVTLLKLSDLQKTQTGVGKIIQVCRIISLPIYTYMLYN